MNHMLAFGFICAMIGGAWADQGTRHQHCLSEYGDLLSGIDDDLRHWQQEGISMEIMDQ